MKLLQIFVLSQANGITNFPYRKAISLFMLCVICATAWGQSITIKGKVTDATTGEELIGVTVQDVQNASHGTITNADGNYSLTVDSKGKIAFRTIGYESLEVEVKNRTTINVLLKPLSYELDEVEVVGIGYSSVAKSDLTSSIATVSEKDIVKTPVTSIEQALQGNAAGVLVINTSAEPGGAITIRIRGGSSISGGNEPLIVIDGFPTDNNALQALNPNDVKSMEVMKDASATAIYGSRGANGVVLITTHSGTAGKATIKVNAKYSVNVPARKLPMMDAEQYTAYDNYGRMSWGVNSVRSLRPDTLTTTDFQNLLIKDRAMTQDYSVNISGKVKDGQGRAVGYYTSAGYSNEEGLLSNSKTDRMTFRGKFDIDLYRNVSFQVNPSASIKKQKKIGGGGTGAILRTLMMNPVGATNGTFRDGVYIDEETGEVLNVQSEISRAMNGNDWTKEFQSQISGLLRWKIITELDFNSSASFSYTDKLGYAYMPREIFLTNANIDKNNKAKRSSSKTVKWVNENFFNYKPTFNDKRMYMAITLGQSWEERNTDGFDIAMRRFDTDYYMWNNLSAASYFDSTSSTKNRNALFSVFTRGIFNYDKRFLTTFSIRTDGSTRFGENKKFGYFPSASAAWVISREKFMKPYTNTFDLLKLRASFGITGNNDIGDLKSLSLLNSSKVSVNGNVYNGNVISNLGNKSLQWETERQFNFGLDVGLFKSRINVAIDAYQKKTFNQLYSYRVPQTTGYSEVMANIGSSDNRGIELELTTQNITKEFYWSTSFNVGYNKNKVTDLGGNDKVVLYYLGDNVNQNITYLMLGQPQAVFMGYKTEIYKDWNDVYSDKAVWYEENMPTIPGMLKYVDTNGDGVIDEDDKVILGSGQPKLMGGLTNTFSYKNFTLTVFINGAWGGKIVNTNNVKTMRNKAGSDNQLAYMLDTYRSINPSIGDSGYTGGYYPVPTSNSASNSSWRDYTANLIDRWVEDGSYLRLKSVTLNYRIPDKIIKMLKMSNMILGVTGVNLLTLTKYTGYDPEMSSSQGSDASKLGVDLSSYPSSKGVTFSLNATF